MKFLCPILILTTLLAGCANVDPSAANRERNRERAGLPLQNCPLPHFVPLAAPVPPRCLA
jgi:hypothetical protein